MFRENQWNFYRIFSRSYYSLFAYLDTCFYGQWFYGLMVGEYGLLRASEFNKEYYSYFEDSMSILAKYYRYMQYDAKTFGDSTFLKRSIRTDDLDSIGTIGMIIYELYIRTEDEELKKDIMYVLLKLSDSVFEKIPRMEDGTFYRIETLWADDTFMSCPFLVRMGNLTGDTKYYDEVIRQLKNYTRILYMEDAGIFSHIYFTADKKTNRVPWGRGNGWVYFAFAEVIEHLPNGYPGRDELIAIFKKAVCGLVKYQDENGMFHQVLNLPESYAETSCTAIFSVALSKGIKLGILEREEYYEVVKKAVYGLMNNSIASNGDIYGVCLGSGCSYDAQYYANLMTVCGDDHGTGVVIAAMCEFLNIDEETIMCDTNMKKQIRIKRANTDWWINEKSVVGANGKTYIGYITDMGEIHIKEIDAKCSKSPSRDVCVSWLNNNYADEHNAPGICILKNGKIVITYTGHSAVPVLRYRITENPYDIYSFGEEKVLNYEHDITYVQIFENTAKNEIWLFSRVNSVTWEFRYSKDEGHTWSKPNTFLKSEAGGLFYLDVRKQIIAGKDGMSEQWFFALYGHPRISIDHTIRSGIFRNDGQLLYPDGSEMNVNLYDETTFIDLDKLSVVYDSPYGTTVRLLAVSPTLPLRIGFAPFILGNPESAVYYSASFKGNKWIISEPIVPCGKFLGEFQADGSQTYVPGMAYYYGVGEAGYNPMDGGRVNTNRIYLSRNDETNWLMESYVSYDGGKKYEFEETIRKIPVSEGIKIWRPIVPIHAQDNLPVYWHEGIYTSHTGGWHADVCMNVEYDD